ncbi:unnamed protein product [Lampetra fluviatilis]
MVMMVMMMVMMMMTFTNDPGGGGGGDDDDDDDVTAAALPAAPTGRDNAGRGPGLPLRAARPHERVGATARHHHRHRRHHHGRGGGGPGGSVGGAVEGGVPSSPSLTLSARGSQSSAFATPTEDEDDGAVVVAAVVVLVAVVSTSREDLLQADFEGALKFFRVQLPKRYRAEESARRLMEVACGVKVSQRRLKKFEREFLTMREQMAQEEDPVERLKREGRRLQEANLRLEQENDDLAHELVTSKIALRGDLDKAEDKVDVLTKELLLTKQRLLETEGDKRRMEEEAVKLKELCRREMEKAAMDVSKSSSIIGEYKQVRTRLRPRCGPAATARGRSTKTAACGGVARRPRRRRRGAVTSDGHAAGLLAAAVPVPEEGIQSHLREMELELAQTKLKLVEAECRIQARDLEHELSGALSEVQASRRTWLNRTLSSLKTTTTTSSSSSSTGSQAKEPV